MKLIEGPKDLEAQEANFNEINYLFIDERVEEFLPLWVEYFQKYNIEVNICNITEWGSFSSLIKNHQTGHMVVLGRFGSYFSNFEQGIQEAAITSLLQLYRDNNDICQTFFNQEQFKELQILYDKYNK